MADFNKLQAKYVSDFDAISKDDLQAFLELLQADIDAPYRSRRIARIERKLSEIKRKEETEKRDPSEWMALAEEDKAMKERWLAAGASWRCWHIWTIWTYEDVEFYRWSGGFNRPHLRDEIVRAREADERLKDLLREKAAN